MISEEDIKEYFNEDEWNAMSKVEKSELTKLTFNIDVFEENQSNNNISSNISLDNDDSNEDCKDENDELEFGTYENVAKSEEDDLGYKVYSNYCNTCKAEYKDFCSACSMLLHILDTNVPIGVSNRPKKTIPKNILECKPSIHGDGIFARKTIPENVVFGPFDGLDIADSSEGGYTFKLIGGKFVSSGKEEYNNWMQYVNCARNLSEQNLTVFQHSVNLYYRSTRRINVGEELLVYYGEEFSGNSDSETIKVYKPSIEMKPTKVYACVSCCLGFSLDTDLLKHQKSCPDYTKKDVSFKKIVNCPECHIYMTGREFLKGHLVACREKQKRRTELFKVTMEDGLGVYNRFKCDKCGYSTDILSTFRRHYSKHFDHYNEDGRLFNCDICGKGFQSTYRLKKHKEVHSDVKNFCCNICKKWFKNKVGLEGHIMVHMGQTRYSCKSCDYKSVYRNTLDIHVKNVHVKGEKTFKCTECDFKTNCVSSYNRHLKIHKGIKNFKCERCGKAFLTKQCLKKHVRSHTKEKNFMCDQCDKFFGTQFLVKKHLGAVHGKKYECERCNFKCADRQYFEEHASKHSATDTDKKFKCTRCKYQTDDSGNYNKHVKNHDGMKPFQCDTCGKRFLHNYTLRAHAFVHTGLREFKCNECGKELATKTSLRLHSSIHTGNKRYKCESCDYSSNKRASMHKHKKEKHALETS